MVELLFWPALLAYGEAAVAYFGEARRPGLPGRLATWGVRIGWLIQTALLAVEATRDNGLPWSSWAGSLNLFVWLVVGGYLIWGCRSSFRLLGLGVMPFAAALLVLAWLGGAIDAGGSGGYSTVFLLLHVGLVLAAFAGFTLAAALSGLYLWQERRLKRRAKTILRRQAPSLALLDRLAARSIAVALPVLTAGIAVGAVRLSRSGDRVDAVVVATALTWLVYGSYVVLRGAAGWHGRRAAHVALAGFLLVVVVRLALPASHFG